MTGAHLIQLALAATAHAATGHASHMDRAPQARAALKSSEIAIDGRLDEAAWSAATPITAFRQTQPDEGAPATQRTEVRVLFDTGAIYIGARMYDSLGATGVHSAVVRRDQQLDLDNGKTSQFTSDKLTIILDPYHDHLTRVVFEVNPAGVKGDALGAGGNNLDDSWDPVWDAAAHIDSLGWTAEIRIPLSQLRFAARGGEQTWGMQIVRTIDRLNERDAWAFAPSVQLRRRPDRSSLRVVRPHRSAKPRLQYALAPRQRGLALGVPAGRDDLSRLAADARR